MKNKYLILVVIYETKVRNSETINSLLKNMGYLKNTKLVIWDNSPTIDNNASVFLANYNNFEYTHHPENTGLSKVYNTVWNNNKEHDYFIIFDQDSEFEDDYFQKINHSIQEYPNQMLYLPIVKFKNLIVSPAKCKIVRGKYFEFLEPGIMTSKNRIAIASGLVISKIFLDKYNYSFNELLTFYGIDTQFLIDYQKYEDEFCVSDAQIKHNLSFYTENNFYARYKRYLNHKESLLIIYKSKPIKLFITTLYFYIKDFQMFLKRRKINKTNDN